MISLRLVLDTNIIVSAALKPDGLQRTVLLLALCKPAHLYVSRSILEEYASVLCRRELGIQPRLRRQFLDLLEVRARLGVPSRQLQVTADPGDNILLECAEASRADFLVTGNVRHFPAFWKQTKIITARDFLSLVAPHLLG